MEEPVESVKSLPKVELNDDVFASEYEENEEEEEQKPLNHSVAQI